MSVRDALELATFVVTIVALPFAVWVFLKEQRKERENEEEEAYLHLSDAYNDFLKIVLANADLQLRTNAALPNPSAEQNERMLTIFDMLISLFERAFLVAYKPQMSPTEQRRWNSWDDSMREWCRRDDFHNALPLLLRGEDPEFTAYIKRVADEERGTPVLTSTY
jgi:cbb3-type cytochrome oxidase subunit 3